MYFCMYVIQANWWCLVSCFWGHGTSTLQKSLRKKNNPTINCLIQNIKWVVAVNLIKKKRILLLKQNK